MPEQNAGDSREKTKRFTFDRCFPERASQDEVRKRFSLCRVTGHMMLMSWLIVHSLIYSAYRTLFFGAKIVILINAFGTILVLAIVFMATNKEHSSCRANKNFFFQRVNINFLRPNKQTKKFVICKEKNELAWGETYWLDEDNIDLRKSNKSLETRIPIGFKFL